MPVKIVLRSSNSHFTAWHRSESIRGILYKPPQRSPLSSCHNYSRPFVPSSMSWPSPCHPCSLWSENSQPIARLCCNALEWLEYMHQLVVGVCAMRIINSHCRIPQLLVRHQILGRHMQATLYAWKWGRRIWRQMRDQVQIEWGGRRRNDPTTRANG